MGVKSSRQTPEGSFENVLPTTTTTPAAAAAAAAGENRLHTAKAAVPCLKTTPPNSEGENDAGPTTPEKPETDDEGAGGEVVSMPPLSSSSSSPMSSSPPPKETHKDVSDNSIVNPSSTEEEEDARAEDNYEEKKKKDEEEATPPLEGGVSAAATKKAKLAKGHAAATATSVTLPATSAKHHDGDGARRSEKGKEGDEERKADKLDRFSHECSEILPSFMYVSGDRISRSKETLLAHGITHVLNSAGGACADHFKGDPDFKSARAPEGLQYLTLQLHDSSSEEISCFLHEALVWFEEIREGGGRVFIHCHQGVSRSCIFAIAYIMWKQGVNYDAAYRFVRRRRAVCSPNTGFICRMIEWQRRLAQVNILYNRTRSSTPWYDLFLGADGLGAGAGAGGAMAAQNGEETEKEEEPSAILLAASAVASAPPTTRLYRVSAHAPHDRTLVLKLVMRTEDRAILPATPAQLDPRTCFVVWPAEATESDCLYIWIGRRADPGMVDAASLFTKRLAVIESPPERVERVHQGSESAAFWRALSATSQPPSLDCVVPPLAVLSPEEASQQEVRSYDADFALLRSPSTPCSSSPSPGAQHRCGAQPPPAGASSSFNPERPVDDACGAVRSFAAVDAGSGSGSGGGGGGGDCAGEGGGRGLRPPELKLEEIETEGSADGSPRRSFERPRLFQCTPVEAGVIRWEWDRIGVYDHDDLDPAGMFRLLLPEDLDDSEGARLENYLWVGKDFADKHLRGGDGDDGDVLRAAEELARSVGGFGARNESGQEARCCVQVDGEESEEFWTAFEDGL